MTDRDDEDDGFDGGNGRRWVAWVGGTAIFMVFGGVVYALVSVLSGTAPPPQPKVQQISIIQPPPPPPPPEVTPPPPEEEKVEIPEPETEPEPVAEDESDEPPPGEDLALDADGVAGSDGFGLRARKGGRGLLGGGDANRWYAGIVQNDLQRLLAGIDELRQGRYSIIVRIWLDEDGRLTRSELVDSSGDAGLDTAIREALESEARISQAPPSELPQPIKLRISSRT